MNNRLYNVIDKFMRCQWSLILVMVLAVIGLGLCAFYIILVI